MVAYSFNKRFAQPIIDGLKTQTIRADGKRQHAKSGDLIQLYTGMRTKQCCKIIPDVMCNKTLDIEIDVEADKIGRIAVGLVPLWPSQKHMFSVRDGFADLDDMHAFWIKSHGTGVFVGKIIFWGEEVML